MFFFYSFVDFQQKLEISSLKFSLILRKNDDILNGWIWQLRLIQKFLILKVFIFKKLIFQILKAGNWTFSCLLNSKVVDFSETVKMVFYISLFHSPTTQLERIKLKIQLIKPTIYEIRSKTFRLWAFYVYANQLRRIE